MTDSRLLVTVPGTIRLRDASPSEILSAAFSLPGVETVEMRPCCTNHEGKPMCSPAGDVVSGNGECAEFLLPAGRYVLFPIPETPDE